METCPAPINCPRSDNEDPNDNDSKIDMLPPTRVYSPLIEQLDPNLMVPRTDKSLPKVKQSKTEQFDPNRDDDRTDKDEENVIECSTEDLYSEPNIVRPTTERVEPARTAARIDNEEPTQCLFKIVKNFPPN
jgi:hypothetical protein